MENGSTTFVCPTSSIIVSHLGEGGAVTGILDYEYHRLSSIDLFGFRISIKKSVVKPRRCQQSLLCPLAPLRDPTRDRRRVRVERWAGRLGLGHIVTSDIEVPSLLVDLVESG